MGVARGKSGWGSFPKGRRPRAGCGAEPHVAPQVKMFWVLDGGRWNSQNLRSREGFYKKLKSWRGVWGAALAKFLILMLFYVFLHHLLSIFLIFNIFLSFFFLMFSSLFCQFWVFTAMPGWGSCPLCPTLVGQWHARVGLLPHLPPLATPLAIFSFSIYHF